MKMSPYAGSPSSVLTKPSPSASADWLGHMKSLPAAEPWMCCACAEFGTIPLAVILMPRSPLLRAVSVAAPLTPDLFSASSRICTL